jgi:hypothetical protein
MMLTASQIDQRTLSDIIDLLTTAEEYFDCRADAEYFTDSPNPVPNVEMTLLTQCGDLLNRLGVPCIGRTVP